MSKLIMNTRVVLSLIDLFMHNTVKPVYNDHLMGYISAFWSSSRWPNLDELQKAEIVNKSKLIPSVFN